jgi:hypothetical protein
MVTDFRLIQSKSTRTAEHYNIYTGQCLQLVSKRLSGNAFHSVAINCSLQLFFGNYQTQSWLFQLVMPCQQQESVVACLAATILENLRKIICCQQTNLARKGLFYRHNKKEVLSAPPLLLLFGDPMIKQRDVRDPLLCEH